MYLKSIKVHGFKSFANTLSLEFDDGITAIVGPNGSGKSNIADAVRWVLGEQKTKTLRSSNTQDVIFAGTENRRPQSYAYVALTLDNSDRALDLEYNEVTVSRRVYRSGENEYLINGAVCRRRDIWELFYDTGIGKEGYSIIGQGQIEKILSEKPEERRDLFDEAAGIVKYKKRKAEALKKLEDEEQNLERITDILSELDRRVPLLKRQTAKAKEYLKKREEQKKCEVELYVLESARIEKELKEGEKNLEILSHEQSETAAEYEKTRTHQEELEGMIADAEETLNRLKTSMHEDEVERERAEGRIELLKEQIRAERGRDEIAKERIGILKEERAKKEESAREYETSESMLKEEMSSLWKARDELIAEYESRDASARELTESAAAGEKRLLSVLNDRVSLETEREKYETLIGQADIRRIQLKKARAEQKDIKADEKSKMEAFEKKLGELESVREDTQKEQEGRKERRVSLEREERELTRVLDQIKENYHKSFSALESLKNIAERYEGFGGAVQKVMEERHPGVIGVVADLLSTEKKYETAIETALGGGVRFIVTDGENTAKELIAGLKEKRRGRVTFLPLSDIEPGESGAEKAALKERGIIGTADQLVRTENKYRPVAKLLLGRILVAEDIECALAAQKKHRSALRIVTRGGEMLRPGGTISGGAYKNAGSLIGRRRELSELERQTEKLKREREEAEEKLHKVNEEINDLKGLEQEQEQKIQEAVLEIGSLKVELSHMRKEQRQLEEVFRDIQSEEETLNLEEEKLCESMDKVCEKIERSHEAEAEIRAENADLEKKSKALGDEIENARDKLNQISLKETSLREQISFAEENLRRVRDEICALDREKENILSEHKSAWEQVSEKQNEIQALKGDLATSLGRTEENADFLKSAEKEREYIVSEHRTLFEKREELSQTLSRLEGEALRIKQRMEERGIMRESLREHLWEEYEMTPHEAREYAVRGDAGSAAELKREAARLKGEIRALGSVNVDAIEEYAELSKRHEFLSAQHADLLEAEAALRKIVRELDEGMVREFREKFGEIQKEFHTVFSRLFGGGSGQLELVGDDILESGVCIVVQPPGKKLQNMMQLSGGEKALTAIALLFTIQNLKPSPFCLLDEIEAALDDANVERFARYLGGMSKNTQFIMITHRRGTMNAADRLYGITMQEKGVSALVSVSLIERQLEDEENGREKKVV